MSHIKPSRITPHLMFLLVGLIFALFYALSSHANTVDWQPQPGEYYKYEVPATKSVTVNGVKTTVPTVRTEYIITTDNESAQDDWKRLDDLWIKNISPAGAVRYFKKLVNVPPAIDECVGQFVCHTNWGWIVNISQNQVNQCQAIKITKEQAAFFENAVIANGQSNCPVWPKQ